MVDNYQETTSFGPSRGGCGTHSGQQQYAENMCQTKSPHGDVSWACSPTPAVEMLALSAAGRGRHFPLSLVSGKLTMFQWKTISQNIRAAQLGLYWLKYKDTLVTREEGWIWEKLGESDQNML